MIDSIDKLKIVLKEKGYKLTPQRRGILEVIIQNQGKHLSTEEIYDIAKVQCPEIGLATVYRTLILLEELEVITKVNFDDGCSRYELNLHGDEHQHHHLICIKCGAIIEVQVDLLDNLEDEIERTHDFEIKDHRVKFFGLCSNCKKSCI